MGRIVRNGVQAFEVVDEGRGLVREARFGASVMSELEAGLPAAFNIMNFLYKIFLGGFIAIRNKVVSAEELEAILAKEEEKRNKKFGGGLVGAFAAFVFTSTWLSVVFWQIIVALGKKAFVKIKQLVQRKRN